MEKDLIVEFLTSAGFTEGGKYQYTKEGVGTIFIREWSAQKVLFQIMEIGEQHHAKKMRDLLRMQDVTEVHVFTPQS